MISRALGGKTGRSVNGWEVGLKKISVLDALHTKPYAHKVPSSVVIIEIHQDEARNLLYIIAVLRDVNEHPCDFLGAYI